MKIQNSVTEHWFSNLDLKLQSELKELEKKYLKEKQLNSKDYESEKKAIISGYEFQKKIVTEQFKEGQQFGLYKEALTKGKIIVYKSGEVIFFAPSGNIYKTNLTPGYNEYKIFIYLAKNPYEISNIDSLEKILNPTRRHAQEPLAEDRVRSTIQSIRKKLGINNNSADDIFLVNKGFQLKFTVELR